MRQGEAGFQEGRKVAKVSVPEARQRRKAQRQRPTNVRQRPNEAW